MEVAGNFNIIMYIHIISDNNPFKSKDECEAEQQEEEEEEQQLDFTNGFDDLTTHFYLVSWKVQPESKEKSTSCSDSDGQKLSG